MALRGISQIVRDILYGLPGIDQPVDRLFDHQALDVNAGRNTCRLVELGIEMRARHADRLGQFVQRLMPWGWP